MGRLGSDMEVQFLPGVGPKRAELLRKELGAHTVGELLRVPAGYKKQNAPDFSGAFFCKMGSKKRHRKGWRYWLQGKSDGPLNLVGTEASGTGVHMARSTVDHGLDPLYIGLPGTVGTSVGVGNLNAEGNALATIITLSHSLHLQSP